MIDDSNIQSPRGGANLASISLYMTCIVATLANFQPPLYYHTLTLILPWALVCTIYGLDHTNASWTVLVPNRKPVATWGDFQPSCISLHKKINFYQPASEAQKIKYNAIIFLQIY